MNRSHHAIPAETHTDLIVVGGGIVGLATAMTLQSRFADQNVVILEAEDRVATHQSGHNSGVLHSGLYYRPGSIKAKTCRAGKAAMEEFCRQSGVPFDRCGKVVVATTAEELTQLDQIADRAKSNGVQYRRIDTDELREREPAAAGLAALHVPETGIVDYAEVCRAMVRSIEEGGGQVLLNYDVNDVSVSGHSVTLGSRDGRRTTGDRFVNCGGLRCDRVFAMAGGQTDTMIVPFRGEYYELNPQSESLCRHLIYPVPDPSFPFLGVHFTRMIQGGVECGPNAVLAMSRQGYTWREWNFRDLGQTLTFPGFRRLAARHWRMGLGEMHRSLSKSAFVRALQKLIPSIRSDDLRAGRSGVRAQAVGPDGKLVDDFLFERAERSLHVLNAPSPGATASLAIAEHIVDQLETQ